MTRARATAGEHDHLDALATRLDDLVEDREQRGTAAVLDRLTADLDHAHLGHDSDGALVDRRRRRAGQRGPRECGINGLALAHEAPPLVITVPTSSPSSARVS